MPGIAGRHHRLLPHRAAAAGVALTLLGISPIHGTEPNASGPDEGWTEALFTGTVAGKPAVAFLRVDARFARDGTYFYQRHGRDIALLPGPKSGHLLECPGEDFDAPPDACGEPTGAWSVRLSGDRLDGTWRASTGAKASKPIALARDRSVPAESARERYEALRVSSLSFEEVSRHERNGLSWKVVKERLSGVSGPLLVSGPDPDVVEKVNSELRKRLLDAAADALSPGEHEVKHTVEFASSRLFSVGTHTGWYTPGAAHPSNGFNAVTWDLVTGRPVDWSRVFRLVDPKAPKLDLARKDLLAAAAIRRMVAGPDGAEEGEGWCLDLALERYGCTKTSCESAVLYPGDPSGVDTWVLFPTDSGLAVVPGVYTEAERGCRGERVVVPWDEVRPALVFDRPLP